MTFDFALKPIKDRFIFKQDEKKDGDLTIKNTPVIQIIDSKNEKVVALLFDQSHIEYARTICYALNCFHGRD